MGFVLYGGTALALHLGHRASLDFDLFRTEPLNKDEIRQFCVSLPSAGIVQDDVDTVVALVSMSSGTVKLSFFGNIRFGRVGEPFLSSDGTLLVASLDDLLATKLKAILDRAEARDYEDIAALLRHGLSLQRGLAAFHAMFHGEPATVLRAIGWFQDGNLQSLSDADRQVLLAARDRVGDLPHVHLMPELAPSN